MCEYRDCIYYGKKDECGVTCDEAQEKICREIRKRAAEGGGPYEEDKG